MQPLIRQLQVMNTQLNTFTINNVIENKNNYNCTKISVHVYNFFFTEQNAELQNLLSPFLLRRVKSEVR